MNNSTDQLLTVFFLLLAVVAFVLFFALPDNRSLFFWLGGVAAVLRIIQYLMRFIGRRKAMKAKRKDIISDLPEPTERMKNNI